jgi:hypothetical protein
VVSTLGGATRPSSSGCVSRTPIDASLAEPFDSCRLGVRMRTHHGPKASRENAVEFLNGYPHRAETWLYIGNLPLQDAFPNRAFLQPESIGD